MNAHASCSKAPTLAELKTARITVAELMTRHNRPQYAPILKRLTAEIRKAQEENEDLDLAMQILQEAKG